MPRLSFIPPSAPVLVSAPPTGKEWLHEIKWDGWRLQIIGDADGVRIYSRKQRDLTKRLRGIVTATLALAADTFIIDAELVGAGEFHQMSTSIKEGTVSAVAFDLLHLNGEDLRQFPLDVRKEQARQPDSSTTILPSSWPRYSPTA